MTRHPIFAVIPVCLGVLAFPAAARAQPPPPAAAPAPAPPAAYPPPPYAYPPPGANGVPLPGAWGAYPPPDPEAFRPQSRWYGWQILTPGLVFDTLVFASVAANSDKAFFGLALTGLIGHGISGPIVHLAHGHLLKAVGSLALESLPAILFGTGIALPCTGDDACGGSLVLVFIGVPVALTATLAIDSAVLGWETVPPRAGASLAPTWRLAPLLVPSPRTSSGHALPSAAGLSVVGTF